MPFRPVLPLLLAILLTLACGPEGRRSDDGGDTGPATEGEGEAPPAEGEGEGPVGEGEGEGPVGEGEGEGPVAEGEGEGTPAEGEGEGPPAEGEGEGAPAEGEGEGPAPEGLVGTVIMSQTRTAVGQSQAIGGNGGAWFGVPGEDASFEGCRVIAPVAAMAQRGFSAGPIRVTGGNRELLLTPRTDQALGWVYDSNLPDDNADLFDANQVLAFSGEGGPHVGAFAGQMDVPQRLSIDSPDPTDIFNLPRGGRAIEVRWNGSNQGRALIAVFVCNPCLPRPTPVAGNSIICLGADDGRQDIGSNLAGQLPRGDGATVGVSRIRVQEVQADDGTDVALTIFMTGGTAFNYNPF
jgi:hypothetical protein